MIIDLVHLHLEPSWTDGGHGLLGAMPRSYQVTPRPPRPATSDTAKGSQTSRPTARKRVSSPPVPVPAPSVGRHRRTGSQQQAWQRQPTGCRCHYSFARETSVREGPRGSLPQSVIPARCQTDGASQQPIDPGAHVAVGHVAATHDESER